MNKKITAVTLTAIMVLTLFTALVPTASAATEVAAPYEFIGIAKILNETTGSKTLPANSSANPSILYYDIDDQVGNETLDVMIETDLKIKEDTGVVYTSTIWTDNNKDYVSYLGDKHFVVKAGGSEWILSQVLVEEDADDDHLLRVGESLSLAEGFAISALEIDVEGKKAWISVSKDGEELKNLVVTEKGTGTPASTGLFEYKEDLGATDDTVVMTFIVDTVFAGMNTNLVKIHTIELISMETSTIESGDDTIDDYTIGLDINTIEITNDKDITASEDDSTDILGGKYAIKVGEATGPAGKEQWVVGISKVITEPGTYELFGVVRILNETTGNKILPATSSANPSILYYDIDDQVGIETLDVTIETDLKIKEDTGVVYTSTKWPDNNKDYISYLGDKHFVVKAGGSEWILSQVLVEEDADDDHLLRVGESLSLAEGFTISALEIDVEGKKAWISVSKDGEELKNLVVTEKGTGTPASTGLFEYKEDLGATDDTVVMTFIVDTVFAGMNTNLVKIHTIELISMETSTIESGDDTIDDYTIGLDINTIEITNDKDITASEDDSTDILGGNYAIKVGEATGPAGSEQWAVGITKTVIVGGGEEPTPTVTGTATPTGTGDPNATATPTATGDPDVTATPTASPTSEPTPEPTPEPGFEAVFAVAGLLAVAYLVLRQRE